MPVRTPMSPTPVPYQTRLVCLVLSALRSLVARSAQLGLRTAVTARGAVLGAALAGLTCTPPDKSLWTYCSDVPASPTAAASPAPTYEGAVKAIVDRKCVRCHEPGGLAPFSLRTYHELVSVKGAALDAVEHGHMPPWMPARCCAEYRDDFGLTEEERATLLAWGQAGAPEGEPVLASSPPTAIVGALDRVDLRLQIPEPHTPAPPRGSTDETRCFVMDWPLDRDMYVTGFEVRPGNRAIVHHLVLSYATGDAARALVERDRKSAGPGFDCGGGLGGVRATPFAGSLGASRLPDGYGVKIPARSKILFNIHYSTARVERHRVGSDRTAVDFRVDPTGKPLGMIVVQNPAWLVGDAMLIEAGDPEAIYYYRYRPTLFTGGKRVWVHAATPHMHNFGRRFVLGILRADGTKDCLLEIADWHFGWEQFYWLKTPKVLNPDDQIYIECRFDNSITNQAIVDGVRRAPRDLAWGGNDQDMCAGFVTIAGEP